MLLTKNQIDELLNPTLSENKTCTKCLETKSRSEFNNRSASKNGLSSQCKECNKVNLKNHYSNNKEYYLDKNKNRRERLLEIISDYKLKHGCSKCGYAEYAVALDFHHRLDKKFNISQMLHTKSIAALVEELNKCDILCANCHRVESFSC